jgi:hypothetical protein
MTPKKMAPKTTRFIPHSRRNCRDRRIVRGAFGSAGDPFGYGTPVSFAKIYREFRVNGLLSDLTAHLTFLTKPYRAPLAAGDVTSCVLRPLELQIRAACH